MQNALLFLVKTIAELYLATFLLRFIMQWVRADYYNPAAQFILKVTSPLVIPARRFLPSIRGLDFPTLVVLTVLQCAVTWLLIAVARSGAVDVGSGPTIGAFFAFVALGLVNLTLMVYTIVILVYALLSFVNRGYNPIETWLGQIAEPVLKPVRRVIPPIGGLDLSPLLVILLFQAVRIALPLPFYLH
jgi:YggT family protein